MGEQEMNEANWSHLQSLVTDLSSAMAVGESKQSVTEKMGKVQYWLATVEGGNKAQRQLARDAAELVNQAINYHPNQANNPETQGDHDDKRLFGIFRRKGTR